MTDDNDVKTLAMAISTAALSHSGQVDKAGQPYILHPIRVMLMCETIDQRIVAMLHDTLEDTTLTRGTIVTMFGMDVLNAVVALTKRPGEEYKAFIKRCAANPLARVVKVNDIRDNLSPERLELIPAADQERLREKYDAALSALWRA